MGLTDRQPRNIMPKPILQQRDYSFRTGKVGGKKNVSECVVIFKIEYFISLKKII